MNEQKALEILELNPDSTKEDISKRYGILTRKFKTIKKDEKGYTIEDVTRAYNLLMGYTFSDKKEEERQKALREHPPMLARLLKKDPVKLENFFHYYKVHMLAALGLIIFLVFMVRSCINNVPADFTMTFFGKVYAQDQQIVEQDFKQRFPEFQAPSIQLMSSMEQDAQYEYAIQMKFMAMISAQEIDMILVDQSNFETIASQGMLLPLDDRLESLGFASENHVKAAEIVDEKENGELVYAEEKTYGIDISGSDFVKKNGIIAEKTIAAIVVNSKRIDAAANILTQLK